MPNAIDDPFSRPLRDATSALYWRYELALVRDSPRDVLHEPQQRGARLPQALLSQGANGTPSVVAESLPEYTSICSISRIQGVNLHAT